MKCLKEIEVKEVVISTLATRGQGIEGDPIRRILQVYEKNGDLIAEKDPELDALPKSMIALKAHFSAALKKEPHNFPKSAFQHELDVAMRWLYQRIPDKNDTDPHVGLLPWDVIKNIMQMVREGRLIEWVEKQYNKNCQPHEQINTQP